MAVTLGRLLRRLSGRQTTSPTRDIPTPAATEAPAPVPVPAAPAPAKSGKPWPRPWVRPGHFYSPLVDTDALAQRAHVVFDPAVEIAGIDLRIEAQLELLRQLAVYYPDVSWARGDPDRRFQPGNSQFPCGDAYILAGMLRRFRPARIIEVGSGHSSAVTLDVNERFFGWELDCTFIEPFPDRLRTILRPGDMERVRLIESVVQEVDTSVFSALQAGDVLFIDSTHVGKCDSDVLHHLFRILPSLNDGVIIHIHDIYWPFEYLREWFFEQNRSWNEAYLLRAFLMDNPRYEILFFNGLVAQRHGHLAKTLMPDFMINSGDSFWMRKRAPPAA